MEILTLGSKIKKRRKELNLTLKELAGDRVTPAQLSYVETDKCKPSLDLLEYIAGKLGLEMDYLLESEKKQVSRYCEYNIKASLALIIEGRYKEALSKASEVAYASEEYGLKCFHGEAERCLGIIYRDLGRYREANNHYLKALEKFSQVDSRDKIAEIYLHLALICYEKKYNSSSLAYLIQAERFVEKLEDADIVLKVKIYYYMMKVYDLLGNNKKSLFYAELLSQSLKILNNRKKYGEALLSTAKLMEEQNKFDRALENVNKALNVYNIINAMEFVAKAETNLGNTYSKNNMLDESFTHLYKAAVLKKVMDDDTIPLTLMEIARNHIIRKDFDKAFDIINEALNLSIKLNNRQYEAMAYELLYSAYNEKGEYIKAEESIRRCSDILESNSDYRELACCCMEMGEFYRRINREKEAVEFISKSIETFKKLCCSGGMLNGDSHSGREN